jgi:hypothetical protein
MRKMFLVCFLLFGFVFSGFSQNIVIKVYGSGGMVSDGETHKICPNSSDKLCATINLPDTPSKSILVPGDLVGKDGTLILPNYQVFRIKFVSIDSFVNASTTDCKVYGSNLMFNILK